MSFAANLGLISIMPGFILEIHERIHGYELPIIVGSGLMLALGWAAHIGSRSVDCHDDGCYHPPCTPQKNTNARILQIATLLFILNMGIFLFVHKNILGLKVLTQPAGPAISHSAE